MLDVRSAPHQVRQLQVRAILRQRVVLVAVHRGRGARHAALQVLDAQRAQAADLVGGELQAGPLLVQVDQVGGRACRDGNGAGTAVNITAA